MKGFFVYRIHFICVKVEIKDQAEKLGVLE